MNDLSVLDALRFAMERLAEAGVETPRLDSQLLLAWALSATREDLAREPERVLGKRERLIFEKAVSLRAERRPLPYITGEQWFYGRPFKINRAVLIPRPETELLIDFAKDKAKEWVGRADSGSESAKADFVARATGFNPGDRPVGVRIADIGVGSGAIAVTLALEIPSAAIWAVDISPLALKVAQKNVRRHNVGQCVHVRESDLFAGLRDSKFHIVVSNPPYVAEADVASLMPEVRDYEPAIALWEGAGNEGTAVHERILSDARDFLVPGGWLAMEVGIGQADRVRWAFITTGYNEITVLPDHAGIDRVVAGRFPG